MLDPVRLPDSTVVDAAAFRQFVLETGRSFPDYRKINYGDIEHIIKPLPDLKRQINRLELVIFFYLCVGAWRILNIYLYLYLFIFTLLSNVLYFLIFYLCFFIFINICRVYSNAS